MEWAQAAFVAESKKYSPEFIKRGAIELTRRSGVIYQQVSLDSGINPACRLVGFEKPRNAAARHSAAQAAPGILKLPAVRNRRSKTNTPLSQRH